MTQINNIKDLENFIINNYESNYNLTINVTQKCLSCIYLSLFDDDTIHSFLDKVKKHYEFINTPGNEKPIFLLEEPTEQFEVSKLLKKQ